MFIGMLAIGIGAAKTCLFDWGVEGYDGNDVKACSNVLTE